VHLALCGAEAIVVATKGIGLQVNADISNYIIMFRYKNQDEVMV